MPFTQLGEKEIKVWELLCYPYKNGGIMENNENAVTQTETLESDKKTEGAGEQFAEKNEKTFTQEEVNAMLAKEKKKMPSKEEMKAFNEWKENQKTNEEKYAEVLKENEKLKNDLAYAENKSVVANAGVDSKFQKFVLSEVLALEGNFEDNLKNYLKENSQYLINNEAKSSNSTGIPQNNANKSVSDKQAYLDKKYANNPYYKK